MAEDEKKQTGMLPSGLSEEEQKFLESRGESGLPDQPAAPDAAPAPADATAPAAADESDEDEAEDAIDPATGKRHPRRIAFRKFRALEERFGSIEQENARLRETLARGDERMKIINEALSQPDGPPQEEQDPRPDPQQDVFAYLDWKERQDDRAREALLDELRQNREQTEQHAQVFQESAQDTQLRTQWNNDAAAYAQTQPKFMDAYRFMLTQRMYQYALLGMQDMPQLQQAVENEERNLVRQSYGRNTNPAAVIWGLARVSGYDQSKPLDEQLGAMAERMGFAPPTRTGAPAPARAAATTTIAQEIENAKRGQEASRSLSHGGGSPADRLTPEVVANMSEEQFKNFMETTPKERIRELLGG